MLVGSRHPALPSSRPSPTRGPTLTGTQAATDGDAQPIARGASKTAAAVLRDMIVAGELSPGERVPPERELAQQLGLSRSSVREAVRELSALGVLTARQGDGTYVSTLESHDLFAPLEFALRVDQKSLLHLTELRLILEPHVAATAAARLTDDARTALQQALEGYAAQVEGGQPDPATLIAYDETIHRTLIDLAGNPLIAAIVRSVDSVLRRGKELTVVIKEAPEESLVELRAVVDAVLSHDPPRAQSAMTWHIARWAERVRHEINGGVDASVDANLDTGIEGGGAVAAQ